jgi:hypothetical protein
MYIRVLSRLNNLSLVCLCLSLYISFLLFRHFFFFFFWKHRDRKHYYIKVVESIQFVCTGNSGISRGLCNAFINISTNQIDLYFSGMPDNSDRSKGLVGTYVKTTLPILLIYILNTVRVVLTYGPSSLGLRSD